MTYNQETFTGYTDDDIASYIKAINEKIHLNYPIASVREMNNKVLCYFLNSCNSQRIIRFPFNAERFVQFVIYERDQQIWDAEFFNSFVKSEYKVTEPLDELIRISVQNKFDEQLDKQRRIEHAIQRTKDAVSEAIQLI